MNRAMNRALIAGGAALIVVIVVLLGSCFTVQQTEQALVTQFGRPVRVIEQPGFHTKLPFVQTVIGFDRRLLYLGTPSEEVILGDQRRLIVDSFTMFRITDPLKYYQAVGAGEQGVQLRLGSIVSSAIRRALGTRTLPDVLSADRDRIMANIRDQVNGEMTPFGVFVEDVRIRRADLPRENTEAVLTRMQSERQRVAAQARAEGAEAAQKIRADADRDRTVILADAKAQAEALRGEGQAEASRLYGAAFGQDPEFFGLWRRLDAYREAFSNGKTRLVLTPQDDFLRYLLSPPSSP